MTFFGTFAWASTSAMPNGVCALFRANGQNIGQGFVVGDKLFSAAHVLENKILGIHCTQDGQIKKWRLDTKAVLHPGFMIGLDREENRDYKAQLTFANDWGYLPLSQPIKSDFVFVPGESMVETSKVVSSFPDGNSVPLLTQHDGVRFLESPLGSFQIGYHPQPGTELFVITTGMPTDNLYVDYDIKAEEGHSGAPLITRTNFGKYLVMGIVTGPIHLSPALSRDYQPNQAATRFAPSTTIAKWMGKLNPELFWKPPKHDNNCGLDLR